MVEEGPSLQPFTYEEIDNYAFESCGHTTSLKQGLAKIDDQGFQSSLDTILGFFLLDSQVMST